MKLGIYSFEKIGMFIDGSNLYSAAKSLGFDIDYKKLLELFREEGRLIRAFYYTALFEDQEYSPIRPLVDWLDYNGYTMVTKPAKEFTDAQGRRKVKGNMDMELAIDMLEMTEHLDHVILFSGDGDFRSLVEAVQRKGVRVTVVSSIKTAPPMVADELRRQADNFIELQNLAEAIARHFHTQRPPNNGVKATVRGRPPAPAFDQRDDDEYDEDDEDDYDDEFEDEEYDEDEEEYDEDDEAVVERTSPKS